MAAPLYRSLHQVNTRRGPACYDRDGSDLASRGLYLDVGPWAYHVFEMTTP